MRNIMTISVPFSLKKHVEKRVKENNYSSISEFIRDTVRAWEEEQIYLSVMRSKKDIAEGKFKKLKSLKDLM